MNPPDDICPTCLMSVVESAVRTENHYLRAELATVTAARDKQIMSHATTLRERIAAEEKADKAESALADARRELGDAVEALRPFAEAYGNSTDSKRDPNERVGDTDPAVFRQWLDENTIVPRGTNLGHYRRAAALIARHDAAHREGGT